MSIIAASHSVCGAAGGDATNLPVKIARGVPLASSFAAQLEQCCESFSAIMGWELAVLLRSQGSPATPGNHKGGLRM